MDNKQQNPKRLRADNTQSLFIVAIAVRIDARGREMGPESLMIIPERYLESESHFQWPELTGETSRAHSYPNLDNIPTVTYRIVERKHSGKIRGIFKA